MRCGFVFDDLLRLSAVCRIVVWIFVVVLYVGVLDALELSCLWPDNTIVGGL